VSPAKHVALATPILKCDGAKLIWVLKSSLRSEKHKCALLGIAKMALKKPTCVGDCNDFVCFGVSPACGANRLIAIGDSRTAPLFRRKKCVGKKKQKIFLRMVCESARSRDVKLNMSFVFVKRYVFLSTDVDGRITYNVPQARHSLHFETVSAENDI
jgi:hypothetical protein